MRGIMASKTEAGADKQSDDLRMEWQTIATAPFDRYLELAVIDGVGIHTLVFPCRRVLRGWVRAKDAVPVKVYPTHWREWDDFSPSFARFVL